MDRSERKTPLKDWENFFKNILMYKGRRVLAIVPARSGSKGIINKNIKKIKGNIYLAILENLLIL